MTIGVLAIFAIGSSARIAAACEGGGEEQKVESTIEKEGESMVDDMLNENPFNVEAEVWMQPEAKAGAGKIVNVGSCKLFNRVPAHGKCTFEQKTPGGAWVVWKTV
jgi:hypothetical protein